MEHIKPDSSFFLYYQNNFFLVIVFFFPKKCPQKSGIMYYSILNGEKLPILFIIMNCDANFYPIPLRKVTLLINDGLIESEKMFSSYQLFKK